MTWYVGPLLLMSQEGYFVEAGAVNGVLDSNTLVNIFKTSTFFGLRRKYFLNIAKGTTDPGVDYFNQLFWFGEFSLIGLVWFGKFGLVVWFSGLVW